MAANWTFCCSSTTLSLKGAVGIHQILNCLAGMNNRGMITATKMLTNCFEGIFSKRLGKIHSDLAGSGRFPACGFSEVIYRMAHQRIHTPFSG